MKTKHVLVVEDNQDMLVMTSELLAEMELDATNLMISACNDGLQALGEIENKKFDLIITDLRLPNLNGDELIRRMKSSKGPNRQTPVVLTSGYLSDFGDGKATLGDEQSDASVYLLPKPFRRRDLESIIDLWLQEQRMRA